MEPNKLQQDCIDTLDGSIMVLAGPGTGKTFTIIQRIKNMLLKEINPEKILCLTFSETAANEMKTRLIKEVGNRASAVTIHTYHAFCNNIIQENPSQFEMLEGVRLINDMEKMNLMHAALDEVIPECYVTKWGDSYYFTGELLGITDELKKNRVTKDEYFTTLKTSPKWQGKLLALETEYNEREKNNKLVKTFLEKYEGFKKKIKKAEEAWKIFEVYSQKMRENNFIDFNDMILLVLEQFDYDDDFLRKVSTRYDYILVDEYQDTNPAQNQIVFKLLEPKEIKNIFVVGDDDQIIFGFQGAETDNLEKFLGIYPQTKVICLEENNRSTQTILDLSYNVITKDNTRLEVNEAFKKYNIKKKLTAVKKEVISNDRKVNLNGFGDILQEDNYIIDKITKLAENNAKLSEIAILTKRNDEIQTYATLLKARNIPFQIKTAKSIFELRPSILVLFYLKMLQNKALHADKIFGLILSKPFDFSIEDFNILMEKSMVNHKDFISNIEENIDIEWKSKEKVKKFYEDYRFLSDFSVSESIRNLIVEIINRTGILVYYLENDINKAENIYSINRIVQEAEVFQKFHPEASLIDFIDYINTAYEENIAITIEKDDYVRNAVQLLTLHGAKGREFEHVFIPHLTASNWERKREIGRNELPIEKHSFEESDEKKNAERLKLLFVGITRAKYGLYLSYSNIVGGTAQELTGYLSDLVESELIETANFELTQSEYISEIGKALDKPKYDYREIFRGEIAERVNNIVLSPTSLNSYLKCPREFLYSYILGIPVLEGESDIMSYGSAFHRVLELGILKAREQGSYLPLEEIQEMMEKQLDIVGFSSLEKREAFRERGIKGITKYYNDFISVPLKNVWGIELKLDNVARGDYFVKGYIDRVEKNPDGSYSLFDYKTGSAKKKNTISEGGEYEHYLNQVRFYKLAFETQYPDKKVSKIGLIFVEENSGSYIKDAEENDNELIKTKIEEVYKSINELAFEPKEGKCDKCNYKTLCKLNVI